VEHSLHDRRRAVIALIVGLIGLGLGGIGIHALIEDWTWEMPGVAQLAGIAILLLATMGIMAIFCTYGIAVLTRPKNGSEDGVK